MKKLWTPHFLITLWTLFSYNAAAAAAKSLHSCLTLCNPKDGSPPVFPIPGILQARTLEWVAISFSYYEKSPFHFWLGNRTWFAMVEDPKLKFFADPRWTHFCWRNNWQSICFRSLVMGLWNLCFDNILRWIWESLSKLYFNQGQVFQVTSTVNSY